MEELIKIHTTPGGRRAVSAKDLHEFLGVKTEFIVWVKRMLDYGFESQKDYIKNDVPVNQYVVKHDYILTLDTAKEISMIQRSEKGKQARQYFIACEKRLKEIVQPLELSRKDLALMIVQAEEERERAVLQLNEANKQIEADKPKVIFADAVSVSTDAILIGELAKILKQNGVNMGQNRLFEWMRMNGYLINRKATDYNMPTQYAMDRGLFKIKETAISHSDGHVTIGKTVKVTGSGQQYFIHKFLPAN